MAPLSRVELNHSGDSITIRLGPQTREALPLSPAAATISESRLAPGYKAHLMFDTLQTAVAHHQAGRLDEAERLYQRILAEQPGHADALHLLGVATHQRGNHARAIDLIRQAIAIHPAAASYHSNLAEAYRAAGDLDRAAESAREALRLEPASVEARNNLAVVLRQAGKTDEAVSLWEAALGLRPTWAQLYVNLGDSHKAAGRPYDAVAVYREGVRLCGDAPLLRHNLGQVLLELGHLDEAVLHCHEAARLRPDQPQAFVTLGDALLSSGRTGEAKAAYAEALRLVPLLAKPHAQLGTILQAEGKPDDARRHFAEAARLAPDDPRVQCQAANVLYETDDAAAAAARYREIVRRFPAHPEAHNSLGYILQDLGDVQGALAAYAEAVRLRPSYADAHLNRGMQLVEMGETASAVAAFRVALAYDPNHPEALSGLALCLRDRLPAAELAACERVLAIPEVPGPRRAVLQYGLAQTMDARGQFDRAADLARRANSYFLDRYRRDGSAFDPAEHREYVDRIIRTYTPEYFARVHGWGSESEVPVFILGLPRSGTSLVEQILASHPVVFGAGELNLMRDIYRAIPAQVGMSAPGVDCVGDLTRDDVRALAGVYLDRVRTLSPSASRVVDKMPDNYLMAGLIATLLPKAWIIHTRRDVRDVGLSCWLTHFRHIRWACDPADIAARIREYERLMGHWRKVLPVEMLEVDYEAVVEDLEGAARRIVAFCGLEWDPACLEFHKTKRVVRTSSMTQVREPIYCRSVGRWRHYSNHLGPILELAPGNAPAI
jgi:tetratricopeptide (TPR) repeat protein